MLNHWQAQDRSYKNTAHSGVWACLDVKTIGEPQHDLPPRSQFVDLDIAALAMACIEDAVRVLREGKHHNSQQAINEAAYWMFYDDPTGDRAFSLSWCVGAINTFTGVGMDANWIRERASRWLPRFKAKRKHKIYVRNERKKGPSPKEVED